MLTRIAEKASQAADTLDREATCLGCLVRQEQADCKLGLKVCKFAAVRKTA